MIYQVMADNNEINRKNVVDWLNIFKLSILPERIKLGQYYDGLNIINKQGAVSNRPNYTVNVNMAKYIIDVATAYAFGVPVTYSAKADNRKDIIETINDIKKNCRLNEIDMQQGGDMATYGVSYQLILAPDNNLDIEDRIIVKSLSPEQTFYVVDNTILENPVCAVYFYDYVENKQLKTKVYVYDDVNLYIFDGYQENIQYIEAIPHNMGQNPLLQSLNNDDAFSDIKCVTDVLDAISLLISNTTDDLQSVANAILAFYGAVATKEFKEVFNQEKIANLPIGAKAEWIVKQLDYQAGQAHLDNLLKFLFQIAQVPDLTDEAFGGNQSGVAMQYKLWGLDQLWISKVTKYTKTIYQRLKIFFHLLQYQIGRNIDLLNDIDVTFSKNLPRDNSAEYQMVQALHGVVSDKTLLQHVSIVDDVEAELEELDKEAEKNADMYGFNNNAQLNNEQEKE